MSGFTQDEITMLLECSEAVNRKKKEITKFLAMLQGFIGEGAYTRFGGACEEITRINFPVEGEDIHQGLFLRAIGTHSVIAFELWRHRRPVPEFMCALENGANGVPLQLVSPLRSALPVILTEFCIIFPDLARKLETLKKAAGNTPNC